MNESNGFLARKTVHFNFRRNRICHFQEVKDECVGQLFVAVTKGPDKNNFEKERFLLAPGFRGFSHLGAGSGPEMRQSIKVW